MHDAFILTHQQADLDAFASLLAACYLHPDHLPALPHGAGPELRRLLAEQPALAARLEDPERLREGPWRRIVLVDCANPQRLGPLGERLAGAEEIVIYDHHPRQPGDIENARYISGATGANTTLLVEALDALGIIPSPEDATAMALGIFEDTGSLTYAGVTGRDLRALAWLVERGADLVFVGRFLRQELSPAQITLLDRMLQDGRLLHLNGHEIRIASLVVERFVEDAAIVVSRWLEIERPDAAFALLGHGRRLSIIARSQGDSGIAVHEILQIFGGGGHPKAASATIHDLTLAEAEKRLLEALQSRLAPLPLAGELMTRQVFSCDAAESIGDAAAALRRTPHRGMPVVAEGRPFGYVDRILLDRAIGHGLGQRPVGEYAESLPTMAENAALPEIQRILAIRNAPMAAVVDGAGLLRGLITPFDLIRVERRYALPVPSQRGIPRLGSRLAGQWGAAAATHLRELGRLAATLDMTAYLVGGCVRDLLMHRASMDVDVVVEGDAIALARALANRYPDARLHLHERFGTATVAFMDGRAIDLASSRVEYYAEPAALPEVRLGGIQADLWRRDFSVNAMAMSLDPRRFGEVLDPYHGFTDLKERRLRVLHSLSFIEDPTRILRAIRFENRLKLSTEAQTEALIRNAVALRIFERLSGPRLWRELRLLLELDDVAAAMRRLAGLDLWELFRPAPPDPERWLSDIDEVQTVRDWYRLLYQTQPLNTPALFLRVLLHDLPHEERETRLRYYQLPAHERRGIQADLEAFGTVLHELRHQPSRGRRYEILYPLRLEGLLALMAVNRGEALRTAVSDFIQHDRGVTGPLKATDLMALGLQRGPMIGQWLSSLRRAYLDGEINDRESAMAWLKEKLGMSA